MYRDPLRAGPTFNEAPVLREGLPQHILVAPDRLPASRATHPRSAKGDVPLAHEGFPSHAQAQDPPAITQPGKGALERNPASGW